MSDSNSTSNSTNPDRCYAKQAPENSPPLFQNGNLVFQAHHVGWLVSGIFTVIAIVASVWLVSKHLRWYTIKRQQRHIVRLLFMPPIYATVSLLSYILWNHSTPILLIRDAYESIVLTSFFYLLLLYLGPTPAAQKEIFRKLDMASLKWVFPFGWVKRKPRDGLYFLQLMKWGILQYCFLRPTTTLAAVILDFAGLYCEDSWSPKWGHVYITILLSISVSIAMYCLIQLYVPVAPLLKEYKPLLKLFSVKAVVFLTFWQATLLGGLSTLGIVKDTKYMTADDINIGIGAILETFEMMCFALLHFKAFTYRPYRLPGVPPNAYGKWRALGHALDFRETFRELGEGCVYLWAIMKGRDPEAREVRRVEDYEKVFGDKVRASGNENGEDSRRRRAESWYLSSSTTSRRGGEEGSLGSKPDPKTKPRRSKKRVEDEWDDEGAWLVDDDAGMKEPLTLHNLKTHDALTNSPPSRSKNNGRYRPVSSIIPNIPQTPLVGEFGIEVGTMALDDPPPISTLQTYAMTRGPELRRLWKEEGTASKREEKSKRERKTREEKERSKVKRDAAVAKSSKTTAPAVEVEERRLPSAVVADHGHGISEAEQSQSRPIPNPTSPHNRPPNLPSPQLQLAHLAPNTIPTNQGSLSTRATGDSEDVFYDFDETYVYDDASRHV